MRSKSKASYMISSVAVQYEIHPQTLRLYEREGLLRPSRSEGNTRLYTDEDLERLEFILNLARDLGVNIAGIGIVLQMRERMEEMNRQMQGFVDYVRTEMLSRMQQQQEPGAIVNRAHRLGCVTHQVRNYLLQLDAISRRQREIVREFGMENHTVSLQVSQ